MSKCKACGAEIIWLKTTKNYEKKSGSANIALDAREIVIYVTGTQSVVKGHQPHMCPKNCK